MFNNHLNSKHLQEALDTIAKYAKIMERVPPRNLVTLNGISCHNAISVGSIAYNRYVGKCQITAINDGVDGQTWATCKYKGFAGVSGETRLYQRSDPLTAYFFETQDTFTEEI